MEEAGVFQTLIGTVKGGQGVLPARVPRFVSNPHRYGQRERELAVLLDYHSLFQTLIGTVKGRGVEPGGAPQGVSNPHRYGQRARSTRATPTGTTSGFQTLIGTVKGRGGGLGERLREAVSNPHRYGQRRHPQAQAPHHPPPFQTLIGTVKGGALDLGHGPSVPRFKPS